MKRKFIFFMIIALSAIFMTSCTNNGVDVKYNLTIQGDATGDVKVTFPDGEFYLDGQSNLQFIYGNITNDPVLTLSQAKTSDKFKDNKAAKLIAPMDSLFSVTSADGTYYIHIGGYAEAYGVKIEIDKTFTNK